MTSTACKLNLADLQAALDRVNFSPSTILFAADAAMAHGEGPLDRVRSEYGILTVTLVKHEPNLTLDLSFEPHSGQSDIRGETRYKVALHFGDILWGSSSLTWELGGTWEASIELGYAEQLSANNAQIRVLP